MGGGARRASGGGPQDAWQGRSRYYPHRVPDAPTAKDAALEEITWEEFFEKFDDADLALVYQEETASGQKSNFNKLIGRETAEAREHGDNRAGRHRRR
jgi:hypothetical protein